VEDENMLERPRPAPTRDLDTPDEIAEMVRRFYADVAQDDLLGLAVTVTEEAPG
jgi:truncated hemoglobin YjbI